MAEKPPKPVPIGRMKPGQMWLPKGTSDFERETFEYLEKQKALEPTSKSVHAKEEPQQAYCKGGMVGKSKVIKSEKY